MKRTISSEIYARKILYFQMHNKNGKYSHWYSIVNNMTSKVIASIYLKNNGPLTNKNKILIV
jgi:hypothetical protein